MAAFNVFSRLGAGVVTAIAVAAGLAVLGLLGLAWVAPYRPRTMIGWIIFAIGLPLAFVAEEAFGALLARDPIGRWVEVRTASKAVSTLRIAFHALRGLLLLAAIWLAVWFIGAHVPGVHEFLQQHFGPDAG